MNNTRALKNGVILNNKYRIENILGEGGFGITYKAEDILINEIVAIKEYFPSLYGSRDTTVKNSKEITIITNEEVAFENGLEKFEREASMLAKFNEEPGIVAVKNFFRENNTGYMVMEYIEGITLKEYLNQNGNKLPYDQVISIMMPIMESLAIVHRQGILHRDISPDNIMITSDNRFKLIDFGAARYAGIENDKSLTVMLKEGYAPPEQYITDGKQGPWTDIYALSATMYRMITGIVPVDSVSRSMGKDTLKSVGELCPNLPKNISGSIMKGLSIRGEKRHKSVEDFLHVIDGNIENIKWIITFICCLCLIFIMILMNIIASYAKRIHEISAYDVELKTRDYEDGNRKEYNKYGLEAVIQSLEEKSEEELIDAIKNASDAEIYSYKYDDFDGDGSKELFACTAIISDAHKKTSDGCIDVWYSKGDEVKKVERLFEGRFRNNDDEYNVATTSQYGRSKVVSFDIASYDIKLDSYNDTVHGHYVVFNDKPQALKMIDSADKLVSIDIPNHCLDVEENIMYFSQKDFDYYRYDREVHTEKYSYPIMVLDGRIVEIASCEVTLEEFCKMEGSESVLRQVRDSAEKWDSICRYKLSDNRKIELDSILYNQSGYFVFNYKVYGTFYTSDGKTAFLIDVLDESGKVINLRSDYIAGVYAYVKVTYDEELLLNSMKVEGHGWGKYKANSGLLEVMVTSVYDK